jgi:GR25 family glycosyltransferase involved in LPS biosynthesis
MTNRKILKKVISLRRSTHRREIFTKINEGIDFEFYDGIDGEKLKENEINNPEHFINPLNFPSLGAYGCALSHLNLWNEVIETNTAMTIIEDDVTLRDDFETQPDNVINLLPKDWDFILWGWNFDSILSLNDLNNVSPTVMLFNQDLLRKNIVSFKKSKVNNYPLHLDKCFGIPAYSISPNGAKKFKNLCFPMTNFDVFFPFLNKQISNTGIDIAMNKVYGSINSFVCFPPLAITENFHEKNTIQISS